jgi:hypothetical protein
MTAKRKELKSYAFHKESIVDWDVVRGKVRNKEDDDDENKVKPEVL